MNLSVITADTLHTADIVAQTKLAITVQSVLVFIAKQNKKTQNADIIKCFVGIK